MRAAAILAAVAAWAACGSSNKSSSMSPPDGAADGGGGADGSRLDGSGGGSDTGSRSPDLTDASSGTGGSPGTGGGGGTTGGTGGSPGTDGAGGSGGTGGPGGSAGAAGIGGSGGTGGTGGGVGAGGTGPDAAGGMGTGGAPPMLADGLVAHWTFDEGSGTTARDSGGNGHHLQRTGVAGPVWVPGIRGTGVQGLHGNSLLEATGDNLNNLNFPFSISIWVQFGAAPDGSQVFINSEYGGGNRGFRLTVGGAGDRYLFKFYDDSGASREILGPPTAPTIGAWTHVAVVATATEFRLYVAGQKRNVTVSGIGQGLASSPLGRFVVANSVLPATWAIDELRLYRRGLTEGEVAALAAP